MRGKDLLYDLSFIDDDIVQEAGSDEMPECFNKGNKAGNGMNSTNVESRSRQRSRCRLIAMAACLMLAVGVTAGISQTDMWSWINVEEHDGSGEQSEPLLGASDTDDSENSFASEDAEASGDSESPDGGSMYGMSGDSGGVSAGGAGAVSDSRESSSASHDAQKKAVTGSKYDTGNGSQESSTEKNTDAGSDNSENTQDMIVMSPNPWAADGNEGSVITSRELADYLSKLEYTGTVSNAEIEYTVSSGSGTVYYLNLTEGFARTDVGEAKLTSDQIEYIKTVMENK